MNGKTIGLLTELRDRLQARLDGVPAQRKSLPRFLPDGTEVKTVEQVSAVLGVDEFVASVYMSEAKREPIRGVTLPDGSFPIRNKRDLRKAILAFGRAKDKPRAKRHIIARARALGAVDLLPESWNVGEKRKRVRRVRTPEGSRQYGLPIGSIITLDAPGHVERDRFRDVGYELVPNTPVERDIAPGYRDPKKADLATLLSEVQRFDAQIARAKAGMSRGRMGALEQRDAVGMELRTRVMKGIFDRYGDLRVSSREKDGGRQIELRPGGKPVAIIETAPSSIGKGGKFRAKRPGERAWTEYDDIDLMLDAYAPKPKKVAPADPSKGEIEVYSQVDVVRNPNMRVDRSYTDSSGKTVYVLAPKPKV